MSQTTTLLEFDYHGQDHQSFVKEGVLHAVRLEKLLAKLGQIDLTPEMVDFVENPTIQASLEELLEETPSVDLTSPRLPFLLRVELAEAYLHNLAAQHLAQIDRVEIYYSKSHREELSKPIGTEVIQHLRRNGADEETIRNFIYRIISGEGLAPYSEAMDWQPPKASAITSLNLNPALPHANVLAPHQSSGLAVSALGGSENVDQILLQNALYMSKKMTPAEEAMFKDSVRKMVQTDGEVKLTPGYNGFVISREVYQNLSTNGKAYVTEMLLSNLNDAQKIKKAKTIFPGEIDPSVIDSLGIGFLFGSLEVANNGLEYDEDGKYFFRDDPELGLHYIAIGAQHLLESVSQMTGTDLAIRSEAMAYDERRERNNVGLLGMLMQPQKEEVDLPVAEHSSFFELFGIEDPTTFYQAYKRAVGDSLFEGRAHEEAHRSAVGLKLKEDGTMEMVIGEYWITSEDEPFDPFEEAKENEYVGQMFAENVQALYNKIKTEIEQDQIVVAMLEQEADSPVRIDKGLYEQIGHVPGKVEHLAFTHDRVASLLQFVKPDITGYASRLGVEEPFTKDDITMAYHTAVIRERAHPDMATSPAESIRAGETLQELGHARYELVNSLNFSSPGSSVYLGNVSAMLNQKPL